MKLKPISLLILWATFGSTNLQSQDYEISFLVLGQTNYPDSVRVENLDREISLTLSGSDILLLSDPNSVIEDIPIPEHSLRCYPNPLDNQATIEISCQQKVEAEMSLTDLSGRTLLRQSRSLEQGVNSFVLSGVGQGSFILAVRSPELHSSLLILSHQASGESPELEPLGAKSATGESKLLAKGTIEDNAIVAMPYLAGELLEFTAYLNEEASNVESIVPVRSQALEFSFPPLPVVSFGADDFAVILGTPVQFTDSTENDPTGWSWDFGDGTTSTEQHPLHTYDTTGVYTVKLTATNAHGFATATRVSCIAVVPEDVYGFKHGEVYGYIDARGRVLLDSLEDGMIGPIHSGRAYKLRTTTQSISTPPFVMTVTTWKRYNADGPVEDVMGDYIMAPTSLNNLDVDGLYEFINGRAIVASRDDYYMYLYGFVDENNQEVIPCRYLWTSSFNNGLAAVMDTASMKVGYIDKFGNYVIPPEYDSSPGYKSNGFNEGLAVVSKDGVPCVIDTLNTLVADYSVLKSAYVNFHPAELVSGGLLRIETSEGVGFANLSGAWEFPPSPVYNNSGNFVNGFAAARLDNGKESFFDLSGNLAFSSTFEQVDNFDENLLAWVVDTAFSSSSKKASFIDTSGEKAFPVVFHGYPYCHFVNGYALVRDWNLYDWIYIDTSGQTVLVPPGKPYIYINGSTAEMGHGHFSPEGVALIIFDDDTYGYINLEGDILWQSQESYRTIEQELR